MQILYSRGEKAVICLGLVVWVFVFVSSVVLTFTIDRPVEPVRPSESLECGVALDY
jgi:hypothetical protein